MDFSSSAFLYHVKKKNKTFFILAYNLFWYKDIFRFKSVVKLLYSDRQ